MEKGQRQEALEFLNATKSKPNLSESDKSQLALAVDKISRMFLTEKAQKSFERAESFYFEQKSEAKVFYEEARAAEPSNVLIALGLIRFYLQQEQCGPAAEIVSQTKKQLPLSFDLEFYSAEVNHCSGEPSEPLLIVPAKPTGHIKAVEINALLSQQAFLSGQFELALSEADKAAQKDSAYPEAYYLGWQARQALLKPALDPAKRYLLLCQSVTTGLRRKYTATPLLCSRKVKVAEYVKEHEKQTN